MKGWICYPLWGLEMVENGFGIESPIFWRCYDCNSGLFAKERPA